ncbi:Uncharacterized protein HZ326_24665 [Fusarium oxysporum f. sp. albedinis]|nr:Uncharacterized protein HZ326_24665 [Fusarium oxysporum f. sp. albedinis]
MRLRRAKMSMRFSGTQIIGPPQGDRALGIDDGVVTINTEHHHLLGAEAYLIHLPGYKENFRVFIRG